MGEDVLVGIGVSHCGPTTQPDGLTVKEAIDTTHSISAVSHLPHHPTAQPSLQAADVPAPHSRELRIFITILVTIMKLRCVSR